MLQVFFTVYPVDLIENHVNITELSNVLVVLFVTNSNLVGLDYMTEIINMGIWNKEGKHISLLTILI